MGLISRLRKAASGSLAPEAARLGALGRAGPVTVRVLEDSHTFTTADGSTLWCGGHTPVDDEGLYCRIDEHRTSDPRCLYCNVAGTSYRKDALQDGRFQAGSAVILRPEPTNPHDPNAVGVWDSSETLQVGYVPAALSGRVAGEFRKGNPQSGLIIAEFRRDSDTGLRVGLHMLVAPLGSLLLSIQTDDG
jgi:hypothetical protein